MLDLNSAIVYWEGRGGQIVGKAVTMHFTLSQTTGHNTVIVGKIYDNDAHTSRSELGVA